MSARPGILLVGDSLHIGGTEGQFVEIACGLDRARWDVHVTCLRAVGPLRARLDAAGLAAWSCGPGSFKSPALLTAVRALASRIRVHGIRLVHCFDFYSNVLGVLAARVTRVPVIASQRELGDLRTPAQRLAYRVAMRLADYTVVNSEAVAARVAGARATAGLVVIPNGVDTARFAPAPSRPRRARDLVTIGTLANLRPEKGLEHLLRAMSLVRAAYPAARLVVWGGGPLHADLARLIDELELADVAMLRGPTAAPEAALRALDLFVLPSLSEACSNVLLEAMATALPVVTTSVGGTPWIVDHEVSGLLVKPADGVALAAAITRLLEDPALASRLGACARAAVDARFSVARMLSRVQSLYERPLAVAAHRAPAWVA